jgi:acetolactate synthase-1/2/3 large subunit
VGGQFAEVAQAMGAFSEKVTDPGEIVPAIRRGLEVTRSGRPALLEFITKEEGEYSRFRFG